MKILMVNKFLYPKGGAEVYLLRLGAHLTALGHEVEYFGMAHPENTVGNRWELYTTSMDFHGDSLLTKATYPLRVIYSAEARKKMDQLLDEFRPDVLHINNFNYQLTPSILLSAADFRRKGHSLRIVYTAHDSQLVCPNHMLYQPAAAQVCEQCLTGSPMHCVRGKCIHNSTARSILGALESWYWKRRRVYEILDVILCPSAFMKRKLDTNPILSGKTVTLRNFVSHSPLTEGEKAGYVLYFGRFSEEKGILPLLEACRALPHIPFIFAGSGPLEDRLDGVPNVHKAGFISGQALAALIHGARFSVCPSICHDTGPFSVMESIMAGTPVLGSNRGGIPDLIEAGRSGWIYDADNSSALTQELSRIWNSDEPERYAPACLDIHFDSLNEYTEKILQYYAF